MLLGALVIAGCGPKVGGVEPGPPPQAVCKEPAAGAPQAAELAVATFAVGDRVSCDWKRGGTYYDGRVAELRGAGRMLIHYDDGDVEETTPELCRSLGAAQSQSAGGGLSGSYAIVSSANPGGGGAYAGNVQISRSGELYRLSWTIPGSPPYSGVGIEMNGVLAVGWGTGGSPGVVAYRVTGGQLDGKWASLGSSQIGSEMLSGPAGLTGSYRITSATNLQGASYTGSVAITKTGETHALSWKLPNESYTGVGILQADVLAVGWGAGSGVVSYRIRGNRLEGVWADARGGSLGSEVLERR
jgi:hypothetical protein